MIMKMGQKLHSEQAPQEQEHDFTVHVRDIRRKQSYRKWPIHICTAEVSKDKRIPPGCQLNLWRTTANRPSS